MYVRIIDCGECFSSLMENVNGVDANRNEWAKHNFYPQNDMVGEVVKSLPNAYIVKIKDGIYVPMSRRGIEEISEQEYLENVNNNVSCGMNQRQERINGAYESFLNRKDRDMIDMRAQFKTDIIENITTLTRDFSRNIFLPDLEESAVMYAADMVLNYRNASGIYLNQETIEQIVVQVNDVYGELFAGQYTYESRERCLAKVTALVSNPTSARSSIDSYYARINSMY